MTTMRWTGVLAIVLLAACAGSSSGGSDLSGWDPGVGPGLDNGGTDTPAQGPTVAVTLAGQPLGDAVTASIDAAGGTLASADGRLTVTVPANAVGDATTFSIQPVGTLVPGTIGIGYQLEPSGVTFAQPVTLTYAVPEAGVSRTGVEGLGVVLREDASGHWNWLADQVRDATGKTVSATTTHFCETSIIEGVQLRPLVATVPLGSTQSLEIAYCVQEETADGQLAGLVYNCDAGLAPLDPVRDWSVNGVTGGNGTVGTIQGSTSSLTGTYTAPGTQPNPSVVLAGVWLGAKGRRGDTFVASNLSVGTPGTYQGKVTVTATGLFAYTASGNLTVTPGKLLNGQLDDGIDMTLFDVTGSIKISDAITYSGFPCTADSPSQAVKNTSLNLKKVPLSVLWGLGIQWDLTCDINGTPTKTAAILTWLTGCMPNTVDQNFIPIADPKDIKGSYTRGGANCPQAAGLAATVEWDFLMQ